MPIILYLLEFKTFKTHTHLELLLSGQHFKMIPDLLMLRGRGKITTLGREITRMKSVQSQLDDQLTDPTLFVGLLDLSNLLSI